jgi:uncharacterized protein (TIGR02466 family)
MEQSLVWPVHFYEFHWESHDQHAASLRRACYDLEQQGLTSGVAAGAKGGLYESAFNFLDHDDRAIQEFADWVKECFLHSITDANQAYWPEHTDIKIDLHESWCHITRDGGYHDMHTHPDSSWSAIYYLDIGDMRSSPGNGVNRFYNSNRSMYVDMGTAWITANTTMDTSAQNGKLVIFPSWVPHSAITYRGIQDRIVIAVNCRATKA